MPQMPLSMKGWFRPASVLHGLSGVAIARGKFVRSCRTNLTVPSTRGFHGQLR